MYGIADGIGLPRYYVGNRLTTATLAVDQHGQLVERRKLNGQGAKIIPVANWH